MSVFPRLSFSRSSSESSIKTLQPQGATFISATTPITHNRGGSDASVTIGAAHGDTSTYPMAHDTPRPSYESLTSMYSTQTTLAIDRMPRPASPSAPPVPTIPRFADNDNSRWPPRSSSNNPFRMGVNPLTSPDFKIVATLRRRPIGTRNFGNNLTVPAATPTISSFSDSTASDDSFEVVPQQVFDQYHHQEASNRLSGLPSQQYSPPAFIDSSVLNLPSRQPMTNRQAHGATLSTSPPAQEAPIVNFHTAPVKTSPTAHRPTQPERQHRPKFTLPNSDTERLKQELRNTEKAYQAARPHGDGLGRKLTKTMGKGLAKVRNLGHRGSNATQPTLAPTLASTIGLPFAPQLSSSPLGLKVGPSVVRTIPLREAQQLRKQKEVRRQDFSPKPAAGSFPEPQAQPTQQAAPVKPLQAGPRKVRIVGNANRTTQIGDFLNLSDSNSDSSNDAASYHTADILIIRPLKGQDIVPLTLQVKRKPVPVRQPPIPDPTSESTGKTAHGKTDLNKALPALPSTSNTSQQRVARNRVLGAVIRGDYHEIRSMYGELQGESDTASQDFSATQTFGSMPQFADELYGDPLGIVNQVDKMDLNLQQKIDVATEAGRLQNLYTRPPATDGDEEDQPTMVIDTTYHADHTSWVVTDTSQLDTITSTRTRISNTQRLPTREEPDEAGRLMDRLALERLGKRPVRRSSYANKKLTRK